MKFKVTVGAVFSISKKDLRVVVEAHQEAWGEQAESAELFPQDLIMRARNMGLGSLTVDEEDIYSDDETLTPDELK